MRLRRVAPCVCIRVQRVAAGEHRDEQLGPIERRELPSPRRVQRSLREERERGGALRWRHARRTRQLEQCGERACVG